MFNLIVLFVKLRTKQSSFRPSFWTFWSRSSRRRKRTLLKRKLRRRKAPRLPLISLPNWKIWLLLMIVFTITRSEVPELQRPGREQKLSIPILLVKKKVRRKLRRRKAPRLPLMSLPNWENWLLLKLQRPGREQKLSILILLVKKHVRLNLCVKPTASLVNKGHNND